ncbi:MAG: phosphatidylcholine/phosphatidylserine synthase, partial [Halobacteriales archaeon]
ADVASFAVAPAALVVAVATARWPLSSGDPWAYAAAAVGAAFVATAVMRLALYTAYDTKADATRGIPTTLAATLVGAAVLAMAVTPAILVASMGAFTVWMVAPITYPDLLSRDALIMGVVHVLAVLQPYVLGRTFPWALLFLALAYLFLSPWFYWREF